MKYSVGVHVLLSVAVWLVLVLWYLIAECIKLLQGDENANHRLMGMMCILTLPVALITLIRDSSDPYQAILIFLLGLIFIPTLRMGMSILCFGGVSTKVVEQWYKRLASH